MGELITTGGGRVVPYEAKAIEMVRKGKTVDSVPYETINESHEIYEALHSAYEHFNRTLFEAMLPPCIIVLHRKRGAFGYYCPDRFESRDGEKRLDEIALNPEGLKREEIKSISTLVHEMAHLWQFTYGTPSRKGYHNKQWGDFMESIGLMPSDTAEPGGRRTGQKVSHYIIPNGAYETNFYKWDMHGRINWAAIPTEALPQQRNMKTKYACTCGFNVWGRPKLHLACLECKQLFSEVS
jgi:predicted SprT family Zn-dependent metalloprotease